LVTVYAIVVAGGVVLILGLVALLRAEKKDIPDVVRALSRWFGHPDPPGRDSPPPYLVMLPETDRFRNPTELESGDTAGSG
jgi:hypothetical protein